MFIKHIFSSVYLKLMKANSGGCICTTYNDRRAKVWLGKLSLLTFVTYNLLKSTRDFSFRKLMVQRWWTVFGIKHLECPDRKHYVLRLGLCSPQTRTKCLPITFHLSITNNRDVAIYVLGKMPHDADDDDGDNDTVSLSTHQEAKWVRDTPSTTTEPTNPHHT